MDILIYILFFVFGNIIGSFLNVVIFRLNSGKTLAGRSICMSCSKKLFWYELIPVFSFLIQKGKCRGCASHISHQYPIVEILSGFIFVFTAKHFLYLININYVFFTIFIIYFLFIFSLLLVISFYDMKHKIIPNKLSYTFIILSFISIFINFSPLFGFSFQIPTLSRFLAGPILALFFVMIWAISKGRLMGFADSKIALGIGWILGLSSGIASIMISFWVGALFGILYLLLSKGKINMKTEIPFAPFLVLGLMITFFCKIDFLSLINFFVF